MPRNDEGPSSKNGAAEKSELFAHRADSWGRHENDSKNKAETRHLGEVE